MAVPHLDTRIIDGKKSLSSVRTPRGPPSFCTAAVASGIPGSIRLDNIASLIKVGLHNIPLVGYLIQQGPQSMNTRMKELRNFYPDARPEDWDLIDAGIRVQAIKKEDGDAGIVHFGTEVLSRPRQNLAALLGASPGASVSTNIILEIVQDCFSDLLKTDAGHARMKAMIPSYDENLIDANMADRQAEWSEEAEKSLQLI